MYQTNTAVPSMTQSDYGNIMLPIPSKSEQKAIAAYLDEKTGKIDKLIAEKTKQVEDLRFYRTSVITEAVTRGLNPNAPLRQSKVPNIESIPNHWKESKIKYIGEIRGRIGYRGYTTEDLVSEGEGAYAIGGKHISKNYLDLSSPDYISWDKFYESPEIMVHKGDILIAQRGTLKRAALVKEDIGFATINPSLVLLTNITINATYIHYYLCSKVVSDFIDYLNTQTAVPMISQNQIENIQIIVPPISEQQEIATYLDEKTAKIDKLISELNNQLAELAEYKQAVISEAVTGKVDVRDYKSSL
jgi:type I restriction enzyme S subunit